MFLSGISDEAGRDINTQIRAHRELGWTQMEIRKVDGTNLTLVDDATFDVIAGRLEDAGMQVSSFASEIANWSRSIAGDFQVDIDELRQAIPRMQRLGCPRIRVMSWTNKERATPQETWKAEAIRRMRELARMAEDGGIQLAHENCDGWAGLSPENTLEFLERVDSPALTVIYDTGNPISHGQDPWHFYATVKDHLTYVHIKDAKHLAQGGKAFTYPGEGQGRIPEIVRDLLAAGYDGGFSIEPHVAAIVHEGKKATPEELYASYLRYGTMLAAIVDQAGGA